MGNGRAPFRPQQFGFFFSSRRRHTRWTGDWSSDVYSSDLRIHPALAHEPQVDVGGQQTDVNLWLVREGWVYPSFYDSMKATEINAVLSAWKSGKAKGRVAKDLSPTVGKLDFSLVYRSGTHLHVVSGADKGPVLYPKMFRRLVTWSVERKAGVTSQSFKQFVASGGDKYRKLGDYVAHGAGSKMYALDTLLTAGGASNLRPESTVFHEDPNSQLKKDNKIVHTW